MHLKMYIIWKLQETIKLDVFITFISKVISIVRIRVLGCLAIWVSGRGLM